ncbi:MAG: polyphenol oxidase family protein [bacterium]
MSKSSATKTSIFTVSDEVTAVLGSWRVATLLPGAGEGKMIFYPKQIHGGNIATVESLMQGRLSADGILLKDAGVSGGVKTADCAPVVVVSEEAAVVLHVSRKSIVRGLLENTLTHIEAKDICHIFIGPHICEYHFSFDEEDELLRQFRYRYPGAMHFHKGKLYLSLRKALKSIFDDWRVHPSKIVEDGRCTYEQLAMPSYRRWGESGGEGKLELLRTIIWRGE